MAFTLTIPRFSAISRKPITCSSSRTQCPAPFTHGRSISLRRRLTLLPLKASTDQSGQVGGEEVDSKILPYCSINKNEKRTIGEMEQEFLQAIRFITKAKRLCLMKSLITLKKS